ncbi:MAG: hypothetical protein R3C04_10985 [Hyphomonas sp.]
MSEFQELHAFITPKVKSRTITAISFGTDDKVEEILVYGAEDGQVINYASRKRRRVAANSVSGNRSGTVGNMRLPNSGRSHPRQPNWLLLERRPTTDLRNRTAPRRRTSDALLAL